MKNTILAIGFHSPARSWAPSFIAAYTRYYYYFFIILLAANQPGWKRKQPQAPRILWVGHTSAADDSTAPYEDRKRAGVASQQRNLNQRKKKERKKKKKNERKIRQDKTSMRKGNGGSKEGRNKERKKERKKGRKKGRKKETKNERTGISKQRDKSKPSAITNT